MPFSKKAIREVYATPRKQLCRLAVDKAGKIHKPVGGPYLAEFNQFVTEFGKKPEDVTHLRHIVPGYGLPLIYAAMAEAKTKPPGQPADFVVATVKHSTDADLSLHGSVVKDAKKPVWTIDLMAQKSGAYKPIEDLLGKLRSVFYGHSLRIILHGLESKDKVTRGHSAMVSAVTAAFAKTLKNNRLIDEEGTGLIDLPSTAIPDLTAAATLHDIGKFYVPTEILTKPAGLTKMEFAIIKGHIDYGKRITHEFLSIGLPGGALSHHERWDGTGYTLGLSGQSIPVYGRCIAVSDAFDAMTSKRPYHNLKKVFSDITRDANDARFVDFATRVSERYADAIDDLDKDPALSEERFDELTNKLEQQYPDEDVQKLIGLLKPKSPLKGALSQIIKGAGTQFDPRFALAFVTHFEEINKQTIAELKADAVNSKKSFNNWAASLKRQYPSKKTEVLNSISFVRSLERIQRRSNIEKIRTRLDWQKEEIPKIMGELRKEVEEKVKELRPLARTDGINERFYSRVLKNVRITRKAA